MRNYGCLTVLCCLSFVDCGGGTAISAAAGGGSSSQSTGGVAGSSCPVGTERCDCYGNGTCNAGLTCASRLCVQIVAPATGGGGSSTTPAGGTGSTGGGIPVPGVGGALVSIAGSGGTTTTTGPFGGATSGGYTTTMTGPFGGATSGGYTTTTTYAGRTANGGASAAGTVGSGGVLANAGATSGTGGAVVACQGLPATACSIGTPIAAQRLPVDLVILMDRSISNGYAVGSDTSSAANAGETTRWQVLTAAMQTLATDPASANIGASITFFSVNGGSADSPNCEAARYATPVVPLGLLSDNASQIVAAMNALTPSGLTPTVPALTGAFQYAMAAKRANPTREKAVVMISDGFPTQCTLKSPSDVVNVIAEAASAPIPIRTFIVGVGSTIKMTSAKFNLQNYARVGNTGKPPFVLDEAAGAAAVQQQLVSTLLNIASSAVACEYTVTPPSSDWVVDPDRVMLTYQPNQGNLQEIPQVASASVCAKSATGGWYFDSPTNPAKITACPCSCANVGAGSVSLVFGCAPTTTLE